jgi:3-dehydroquinate dehydratase / shikimate dehydrogenase
MLSNGDIRICVPVKEQTLTALIAAAQKAMSCADIVELRLDALERGEIQKGASQLSEIIHSFERPLILTYRPSEQGGYSELSRKDRLAFWKNYFPSEAPFFDVEADLFDELVNLDPDIQPDWSRVICSLHDFQGVPENLDEQYEQMAFTPARILKLAVQAREITDCIPVFQLMERARREGRQIIAIAMDAAGLITRILGPSRGCFLTYASTEPHGGTAPGQLLATNLRSLYRIDHIDTETMITGLVGLPVSHSVSPHIHNAAFKAGGLNAVYLPFHVEDLHGFVQRMVSPRSRELDWNLRGLSITAPHKKAVLKLLDWVDDQALKIGAVNTVVVEGEQLLGYNTDAHGLIEPLKRRFGSLSGSRVAVLGSGGAACAALYALQREGADITIYVRDLEKAQLLSQRFNLSYESLASANFSGKDIVINATPLGSFGPHLTETPASAEQLRGVTLVYDLVYNPIETLLLKEARTAGCDTLGGLEMLVAQARLQFKLWMNTDTSYDLMYTAGSNALNESFV